MPRYWGKETPGSLVLIATSFDSISIATFVNVRNNWSYISSTLQPTR